jgi:hypothetical protein
MHNVIRNVTVNVTKNSTYTTYTETVHTCTPGASLWADGAYANYGIYVGTMTSYRHVSLFPLLSIILGFEKCACPYG